MKILVPVDGSPPSGRALALAVRLARSLSGALVLLNVQNRESVGLAEAGAILPAAAEADEEDRAARAVLDEAEAACRAAGLPCATVAQSGPIAATILAVAAARQADHIVMGTRGLSALRGLLAGSTATDVLHGATVPVTLVK